jgi:hypothetical protein
VHIQDATPAAEPELERVEPRKDLAISDGALFEAIETDAPMNTREEVPPHVEIADALSVAAQPASPLPHPLYAVPGNGQPMPAMTRLPGMQAPGFWMFHPQFGWVQCVYQGY